MLTPLVPADHRWTQSQTDPGVTERRAVGVEAFLGRRDANRLGKDDIRILVQLSVSTATPSLAVLKHSLAAALLALRFRHPESACVLAWDEGVLAPRLQYRSPDSQDAARAWAQALVRAQATSQTAREVWEAIEARRRADPQCEKPVRLYLLANVTDENAPLRPGTALEMLVAMNHVYWDGVSSRAFVGDLLKTWSQTLAVDYARPVYEWGRETSNLTVPILDALKPGVESAGHAFTADYHELLRAFAAGHAALGTFPRTGPPKPCLATHLFTPGECRAMIHAVKTRLGPQFTISHLGQAATTQAMLETNPPPPDLPPDACFVTPNAIDGRRWLDTAQFSAACVTNGVVTFPNVKSLVVDPSDRSAVLRALTKGAKDTKTSFDHWLSKPSHLPVAIAMHHFSATLNGHPAQGQKVEAPVFLSDGLNDRYLPREIRLGDGNETLMTVDGFLLSINEWDAFYVLRLESWQGASTLSVAYNGGCYSRDEAEGFLATVVKYMLAFAE
ncbi:15-O-acetyltransferase Tri3 [Aspergillus coremiiformis]|uniref:15-O-acetyltransferase Tri3 n=1 Tax=Aspergillus coremiiformis TaxID=138285 RepID=A0A5N6ZGG4_9EURO|nr:15-O-acetyltransferase Tri3 [Aspergillus coremiiformis]